MTFFSKSFIIADIPYIDGSYPMGTLQVSHVSGKGSVTAMKSTDI